LELLTKCQANRRRRPSNCQWRKRNLCHDSLATFKLCVLCSGYAKLIALLWVVLPHSLHPCTRGQSFRLWPFGPGPSRECLRSWSWTGETDSAYVGLAAAFAASGLSTYINVLLLRSCCTQRICTMLVSVCAKTCSLHIVQYLAAQLL
jgi:hypothetical protein